MNYWWWSITREKFKFLHSRGGLVQYQTLTEAMLKLLLPLFHTLQDVSARYFDESKSTHR